MRSTADITPREGDLTVRLSLMIGQAFFLGLTLGLLIVAAFALLVSTYGAGILPWVYIAVAVLGSALFYGFAEAQRRWSFIPVAVVAELVVVAFLVVTWAGFRFAQAHWLAFPAMVVWSLLLQIGFVIVGGQAGRLLDVREIKRYFARIVAGFVVGFMVAGALAGPLQQMLGRTESLLPAAAAAATVMLGLLLVTNARYHAPLARVEQTGPSIQAPPLRKVLAKRFVLLIFAYQMLSAMATQLLEYMVMAATDQRFTGSDALAHFYGNFTFFLNLADLIFLVLVAGFLLSRFGLKFGLTFNPGAVLLLLAAIVAIGVTTGPAAPLFFGMVLVTRILDLTFTDGATRTSINAAYQALPPHERITVQTGVEGVGVPLALGLTGVVLLIFGAMNGVTLVHVAAFGLILSVLWLAAALLVYRDYGANLLKSMRRRSLIPAALTLDETGLDVVRRLAGSPKLSDVRPALDLLESAEHPALGELLPALATSAAPEIRIEALQRMERLRPDGVLPLVVTLCAADAEPGVQGAALRTRCALEEADAVEAVAPSLDAPQDEVRLGAAVGLLRYGSIPGILAAGAHFPSWGQSDDPQTRAFLARVIAATGAEQLYQPLQPLLADPDADVRRAALHAAGRVRHPRLLPLILDNLDGHATRSAAVDALAAYGDRLLSLVEEALADGARAPEHAVRMVRICLQVTGDAVVELMRRHLDHPVDDVRDQVLAVLSARGYHARPQDRDALDAALLHEVRHIQRLVQAQEELGTRSATEALTRALRDEVRLTQRRLFRLLAFIYDAEPILRAHAQLAQGISAQQALAVELLDVTLMPAHKALVLPCVDPKLTPDQRLRSLERRLGEVALPRSARMQDLIRHHPRGWVRACALYAVAQEEDTTMAPLAEAALADRDPVVRETAAWCVARLAPERWRTLAATLAADEDAQVARWAAGFTDLLPT